MELHERIYQLRKQKNMTQQDLADQLGVSRQAVSRWEMGTAKPEVESLTAMSRIFGITVDELLTGEKGTAVEMPATQEKRPKPSNRIWWIIWVVSVVVSLAVAVIVMIVEHHSNPYSFVMINPTTLVAQIINIALTLGIVVFIIRWLCQKRKQ